LGNLRPKFEKVEFNLAEKMMLRVLSVAYGVEIEKVKKTFKQIGDLGEVIERLGVKEGKDKGLSVGEVYKRLMDVAVDEGQGSQDRKVQNMATLIKDVDLKSAKFIMRIPVKKLRLGFSDMTVLDALSWMEKGDKSLRKDLERAFNESADIGRIAAVFKKSGVKGIKGIKLSPGVPVRMAMAERLPDAEKMVEKLDVFAVEPKYDGLRVQIHVDKGRGLELAKQEGLFGGKKKFVRIFSRNLDNVTYMFPDIVEEAGKMKVNSVILDGEAIAYDPKTDKFLPFQVTIQRKRKHGIKQKAGELPLKVIAYDLLFFDGKNVMVKPFKERRRLLEKAMKGAGKNLILAEQDIVSDTKELRVLVKKYLDEGLEGAMCKKLTTVYQAGSRNFNWVKFKKTTEGELVDTLDCVVMGYYPGKGRRSGFGIGAFLVGVRDKDEKIGSIAKIGTGLSDEQWLETKKRCDEVAVKEKPKEYEVDKNLGCDVWVEPKIVVEIMADEITKSPIHAFGLALRFPRLVKFRDDKKVDEATTREELKKLFKMQKN